MIAAPPDNKHMEPDFRQKLFYDYGDFITSLNGCFGMQLCLLISHSVFQAFLEYQGVISINICINCRLGFY